jgi:methionyl-tRNA formyltransferase
MKVVFFGTSTGVFSNSHFEAILAAPCEIVAVVDAPAGGPASTNTAAAGASFTLRAEAAGIPVYAPANPNAPEFVAALEALKPDLFLVIGYTGIMREKMLGVPRLLAANFHASLLPAYRGLHPLYWALKHGEQWVGLTVHLIESTIDTGDILYQVRVPVEPGDTVSMLYDRVMAESVPLVPRLIADAAAGTLVRRPQGSEGASYYGHIPTKQKSRQG